MSENQIKNKEAENMTWGQLFSLFCSRNKDLKRYINDYRPGNEPYQLQLWFKNGATYYVRWIREIEEFVFSEVGKV